MNECQEIDGMLSGLIPFNTSAFGNGVNNRLVNKYTWDDIAFNQNCKPFECDTAIIVTSYHGQLGWLKATLTNYRKSGHYVILAYDNPAYIWSNLGSVDYNIRFFPHPLHYLLAHAVVIKHKTYDADKRVGWFWDVWYAQGIIKNLPNIKYVYVTNGDCIVEKPEGFQELKEILGDGDLMSGQSTPGSTIHTADMIMKVEAFHKIFDYFSDRMRFHIMASQSPEALLRDAVDEMGLKEVMAEQPIDPTDGSVDYYGKHNSDSTWKRVLGFKNLYHCFEYHENNSLEPDFKHYMDDYNDWMYFRDDWRNTICRYYETGDRRYLQMFWDRGKDSCEDRKFLPLEAYGLEPILGSH
jgi:hypothetical protein